MSSRFSWILRLALAATAASLLSLTLACGGDDDDDKSTDEPTATESAADPTDAGDDTGDDGGEASADLEEYFADIEALFEDADADTDELSTLFDAALAEAATLEEEKEALMAFIFDNSSVLTNALDDMEDIDAPSETEDEHDAFIGAGRDLIALSADFANQLDEAETQEEIDAVNVQFDEEGTALAAAADEACTGLQAIADDVNILVDLNCED